MSVHPSGYKVQSKRERKLTKDWWDKAVLKSITQDDVAEELERVRKNDPKFWLRLILDSVPKQILSESNGLQVILNLNGVDIRPLQGKVIQSIPALQDHDPDYNR